MAARRGLVVHLDPIQIMFSIAPWPEARGPPYLDVLYNALVAELSPRVVSRGGEGVWGDVQQRATAGIGDATGSDRDFGLLAAHSQGDGWVKVRTSTLVAQIQRLALSCSTRNLTHSLKGPSSDAQPGWMKGKRCVGVARRKLVLRARRQKAACLAQERESEVLEAGYQSTSGIVRLINMGLPGAWVGLEGCALRYGLRRRCEVNRESMLQIILLAKGIRCGDARV